MLYVEGARDREILECWARRVEPSLARCIERSTVILGGRRPARAVADFQKRGGADAGLTGLIVLDRDHHPADLSLAQRPPRSPHPRLESAASPETTVDGADPDESEKGLEVFVWGLRHIESYLLVPAALCRVLGVARDDARVERALADQLGRGASELDSGSIHAKRILGAGGSLSEALGTELRAGEIARAMRVEDLHADVHALMARIGHLSGLVPQGPQVVIRSRTSED